MANDIEIASYDPKKVNVNINGKIITGFSPDGVINVVRNEDIVTPTVGTKGDVTYNENANESGQVTLHLLGSSSSLPFLRSLAVKRKEIRLTITDANDAGAVQFAEERCRIIKPPDLAKAKEIGSTDINIFVPTLNYR
ncbi:DUF3277 domain-containing protein [Oscillospiraceae bacterium 50-58]